MLVPKLITELRNYSLRKLLSDTTAGIIVGVVALPLAIAFAIASGVTPGRGLWTAIIAGFIISALGGSRVQIGGPTGAFVVIVYGIVEKYGLDGLLVATAMAGVILVVMGLTRMGGMIKFIPQPVITGFTSGIAVIIFTGQIKDLLGLRMNALPSEFLGKWIAYAQHSSGLSLDSSLLSLTALLILILWPKLNFRIPSPFVALVVTTAAAGMLGLNVETIGTRYGALSTHIPTPALPHVSLNVLSSLVAPALTIALLAAIESLLSAVVADGMIGGKHRSNMELIAQGIANIVSPIFGGIPATGAIARTATNIKNGAQTPVAGMVHSLTLFAITLFAAAWAARIPMATLAAILVMVSYQMSEWRMFRAELRSPRGDVAVLLVTFFLTVFVDLTVAVSVGVVLASMLFIRRMAETSSVTALTAVDDEDETEADDDTRRIRESVPDGVEIYEINGPLFFGAVASFKDTLARVSRKPRVLIISMRKVPSLDSTALHALKDVVQRTRKDGTKVLLAEVQSQPLVAITSSGILGSGETGELSRTLEEAVAFSRSVVRES
jgi:SulP family sulfate permease